MEKLSIIVPVYNGEKTIARTIESLICQTVKVKIIVVNDGSKDNTESIVKEYEKKYDNISYYYNENHGISYTRNFGVSKVDTEYFGFLDADDEVRSNMAEKMLDKIEKTNSDICFSNFTWVYEDGVIKDARDVDYKDKHELLEKMFATLWNKIYRTSWYRSLNIEFPDGLRYEDASVLYRLALHMDKICYVDEAFVDYYQIKGSITHTFNININDMIEVFKGIKDYYIKENAFEEYYEEIEYLFIRFFLGNSYLRACRIIDKDVRNDTLTKGWNFLTENFPEFKTCKYLKNSGKKNFYFRHINKKLYFGNVYLFKLLYLLKLMK